MDQRLVDVSLDVDVFNRKNQRVTLTLTVDHFKAGNGHNVTASTGLVSKVRNIQSQKQ